jgi:hypothetical protein
MRLLPEVVENEEIPPAASSDGGAACVFSLANRKPRESPKKKRPELSHNIVINNNIIDLPTCTGSQH